MEKKKKGRGRPTETSQVSVEKLKALLQSRCGEISEKQLIANLAKGTELGEKTLRNAINGKLSRNTQTLLERYLGIATGGLGSNEQPFVDAWLAKLHESFPCTSLHFGFLPSDLFSCDFTGLPNRATLNADERWELHQNFSRYLPVIASEDCSVPEAVFALNCLVDFVTHRMLVHPEADVANLNSKLIQLGVNAIHQLKRRCRDEYLAFELLVIEGHLWRKTSPGSVTCWDKECPASEHAETKAYFHEEAGRLFGNALSFARERLERPDLVAKLVTAFINEKLSSARIIAKSASGNRNKICNQQLAWFDSDMRKFWSEHMSEEDCSLTDLSWAIVKTTWLERACQYEEARDQVRAAQRDFGRRFDGQYPQLDALLTLLQTRVSVKSPSISVALRDGYLSSPANQAALDYFSNTLQVTAHPFVEIPRV